MAQTSSRKDFSSSIDGKKIPILTLDHKWHKLFAYRGMPSQIKKKADDLNQLLMRQGKCNTELKKLKIIKKNLMDEIVPLMADATTGDVAAEKKIQNNKRLIDECNEKIDELNKGQDDLPNQIVDMNYELMVMTMEECYAMMNGNNAVIDEITEWLDNTRVELKKKVVMKQENELINQTMYSFMHDIFGADVIEIFDMKYVPERMKTPELRNGSMSSK